MDDQTWAGLDFEERFAAILADLFPDADTDDPYAWDDAAGEPAYKGTHRRAG